MKLKTFESGIHPAYNKEGAKDKAVERAPIPATVTIPLRQHLGVPCTALVKKGEEVEEGQVLGSVDHFVSAPVHSSVKGKVKDIAMLPFPGGGKVESVLIAVAEDFVPKDWEAGGGADIDAMSVEEIRSAIRKAGIVGMGGAAFPTAVKLSPPKDIKVEAVIINGCECEPYLCADHRIMVEQAEKLVLGIKTIVRSVDATSAYIGIEDNKPDAIEAVKAAAASILPSLKIVTLETKYPQGAEKMLIEAVLKRKVPTGKLPFDVGVVVNNVGTSVAIYEAVKFGKPIVERVITVSGNGVGEAKNLMVRLGTSFQDVLDFCGGVDMSREVVVLNGGPMMGISQSRLDVPVIKGTSGITVLTADTVKPAKYDNCIRCASCVEACPMMLMPLKLGDSGRLGMLSEFNYYGGANCIECGCCAFMCPSKRPLVQWIRTGKLRVRQEAEAEKKKAEKKSA